MAQMIIIPEEKLEEYIELPISKNTIDLRGKIFGDFTVLKRVLVPNKIKSSTRHSHWLCQCNLCGCYTYKQGSTLKNYQNLCICRQNLAGKTFNSWTVIQPGKRQNYWLCKCNKCGTIKEVYRSNLIQGTSKDCGCGRKENGALRLMKDLTNQQFGFLTVNRLATPEEIEKSGKDKNKQFYWNCNCTKCGNKDVIVLSRYLLQGITKSCGCLRSWNEAKIKQMLINMKINFIPEYNKTIKYFIEYDGEQHFHNFGKFETLESIRERDKIKNQFCFKHNIPLIRIPYNREYKEEDLILETTRFLLTKENEKQYYKERNE